MLHPGGRPSAETQELRANPPHSDVVKMIRVSSLAQRGGCVLRHSWPAKTETATRIYTYNISLCTHSNTHHPFIHFPESLADIYVFHFN